MNQPLATRSLPRLPRLAGLAQVALLSLSSLACATDSVRPVTAESRAELSTQIKALIGDAAHTIHPLAGQGVNLGFLDAAVLAEVLLHALERGENLADIKVLGRFERRRMPHNLAMMAAMEGFERLFQADPLPLRWLRNSGLNLVDGANEAKALFVRQALGLSGDLPELARL